jgi:Zn-dependent membrane protease YugP
MSLLAILLFIGTMALSLWATIQVRQVYNRFSLLPASSGSTGADTAAWTYVAAFITSLVYFLLHVFASAREPQRVIHALSQNMQQKGPCTY